MKVVCQCGYTTTCNMSGGGNESAKFNQLVTENIMAHNLNVHSLQKFFKGINMSARNLQGNIVGVNLEHRKMSDLRNQLYVNIIEKKNILEDEMLKAVIESSDCPEFSFDGFYSDR